MMKTKHNTQKRINHQSGFSLLEVLISIVVTSVGLLGLAGMQAAGLRSNHSAYHNSQATVLAYDMADRMRANAGFMSLYSTETPTQVAACNGAGCSTGDLVKNDLFDWNAELAAAIPGSVGTVTLAGTTYTVSVSWDDNRDGAIDANDPNFQVAFQP
jgi:type IV pilus assembly protein PilV